MIAGPKMKRKKKKNKSIRNPFLPLAKRKKAGEIKSKKKEKEKKISKKDMLDIIRSDILILPGDAC